MQQFGKDPVNPLCVPLLGGEISLRCGSNVAVQSMLQLLVCSCYFLFVLWRCPEVYSEDVDIVAFGRRHAQESVPP